MVARVLVFIFVTILFGPVQASMDLVLLSQCSIKGECNDQQKKFRQQKEWNCQLEMKAQNCEQLAKQHPNWAPLMRKCSFQAQCQEQMDLGREQAQACLRGYKNAMIDLGVSLKDMSVSLAGFVENSWEDFKKNRRERAAFLKECDKSIACKRDLVKDDHRYRDFTDEKLAKMPAVFLYTQAQDMKAYQASLDRMRPKPYVPISERVRDEVELTKEQASKLKSLMSVVGDKIKEQYQRYSCYNAVAREELQCYAIGTVVDPTLVAGYFVKGARVAVAASHLTKAEREVHAATAVAATGSKVTRAELTGKYLSYSPTTVAQNEKWISLAEKGTNSKITFLDIENSQMKTLNDTLKDKNLVTGLTNYHKEILFKKIEKLEAANPGLVIDKYSDFKSSRFAFSGKVPADLDSQLKKVFAEANSEYTSKLRESGVLKAGDKAETWFRGGTGVSADQANIAARYSRQTSTNDLQSFKNGTVQTALQGSLKSLETQRTQLRSEVAKTSMVQGNTFHQDVYDIVRKGGGNTEQIKAGLKNRFGLSELSTSTVQKMEKYVKSVDEFSPGIHVSKREIAHLNKAQNGGLSADVIGLGSANLKETAEALANSKNLNGALENVRKGEKAVTKRFDAQKKYFQEVLKDSVDPGKLKSVCSGDDCVAVATKPLTEAEKKKILKNLMANDEMGSSFRMAFIPDGVKVAEARNALANHGESVEKILRQTLSTSMEPRRLKGLVFGVDMKTKELNKGQVQLLIGEAQNLKLTSGERALIQKKFAEAIKRFNDDARAKGTASAYQAVP